MELDENFKRLVQELGEAINESLGESEKISEVLGRIRAAGYDLMLVLEVTVGFNKRATGQEAASQDLEQESASSQSFDLTPNDAQFLRALKITVENKAS